MFWLHENKLKWARVNLCSAIRPQEPRGLVRFEWKRSMNIVETAFVLHRRQTIILAERTLFKSLKRCNMSVLSVMIVWTRVCGREFDFNKRRRQPHWISCERNGLRRFRRSGYDQLVNDCFSLFKLSCIDLWHWKEWVKTQAKLWFAGGSGEISHLRPSSDKHKQTQSSFRFSTIRGRTIWNSSDCVGVEVCRSTFLDCNAAFKCANECSVSAHGRKVKGQATCPLVTGSKVIIHLSFTCYSEEHGEKCYVNDQKCSFNSFS